MKHRGDFPQVTRDEFSRILGTASGYSLDRQGSERLYEHYLALQEWQVRVALVGTGTTKDALDRHYGESLQGLSLLGEDETHVVDIGSGAGFPGFVLAAARSDLEVTLIESRLRKWMFLQQATRRAGLSCRCLNARVSVPLPEGFPPRIDAITLRALILPTNVLEALARIAPSAKILAWVGRDFEPFPPMWRRRREVKIPSSRHRRIIEFVQTEVVRPVE